MNEFSVKLYASGNLIGEFDDLKSAVDFANEDTRTAFTIDLAEGDVDIGGAQVVIRKDITIAGAGMDATTLHADFKTGGTHNDDSAGLILVKDGVTANFSDLKIDGSGQQVTQAIRHLGIGTVEHVHFANIGYSTYLGTGISVRGNGDVDVLNSTFTDIARIGAHFRDEGVTGKFEGNTYTGKGAGTGLDYAAEAGGGATVEFINNTVRNNLATAADGSTSAAFVVTTYFHLGTQATFGGNVVTDSTVGVAAGYPGTSPFTGFEDRSNVTFLAGNNFSGANLGVEIVGDVTATGASLVNGAFYGGVAFGDGDNDLLYFTGNKNQLYGADDNDWLGVSGSYNTLDGGAGDEWIGASGNSNTLAGQDGNDLLFANGIGNDLHGGKDNDWLGVSGSNNALLGEAGVDWMGASGNGNQLFGGDDGDTMLSVGTNVLYGETGGDWLGCSGNFNQMFGGDGADYIAASGQYNVLDGGAGNDILFAGANAHDHDTFAFLPGYGLDTAFNFVGEVGDKIDIRGWGIADYAALTHYLTDTADGLKIAFDGANQLTVQGVHALDPSWLIYA